MGTMCSTSWPVQKNEKYQWWKNAVLFFEGLARWFLSWAYSWLKEKTINIYQKESKYFFELGIDEIYLFGSVLKNEYTSFNDIDIIVKFKKEIININERKSIEHKLKLFNFDKFDRKSDILWFEISKELHDIKTIYRLI